VLMSGRGAAKLAGIACGCGGGTGYNTDTTTECGCFCSNHKYSELFNGEYPT
jgi:hypothetical protein